MPIQASGSRHSMGYIPEVTFGVIPATPAFKALRHNSTTLNLTKNTFASGELRSDRMTADMRTGAKVVGGNIVSELAHTSADDFLEALMCGTWAIRSTVTLSTISAASADNSFNDSANGFITAGFIVGDVLTTTSFTSGADNTAVAVVTSVTAGKMIVTGPTLVTEAAGAPRTITANARVLKIGTTRRSFAIERRFNDVAQFLRYAGCEFNTLALTADTTKIVDMTLGLMGQTMVEDTVIVAGATYPAALTTSPMDAMTGTITEGGTVIAVVTAISFNLTNGMQPRHVIGNGGLTLEPSIGRALLTGQLTAYFQDGALVNKFVNDTSSSVEFVCGDGTNSYDFLIPKARYTGAAVDVSGEGPVSIVMPFTGLLDPVSGTLLQITRNS
jgi:hypothetical protein